ncbi:unnamed protein product [Ectocarpus sp. 12 AP-2014]
MMTFLTIFLILIGLNAIMVLASLPVWNKKATKSSTKVAKTSTSVIYPINLLIGFIMGLSLKTNLLSQNQILLLVTGFCGGFTTFSAFAMESNLLVKDSNLLHFVFYTLTSIAVGVLSVTIGLWISKML